MAEDMDEFRVLGEQLCVEYQRLMEKRSKDSGFKGQQRLNHDRANLAQSYNMRKK